MAKLDLDRSTVAAFAARFQSIQSETQRVWGTMPPEKMMRHVTFLLELSLGEQEGEKVFMPFPRFVIWTLFFDWFTNWPQGKLKAPAVFFPEPDGAVDAERERLTAALYRFVDALEATPDRTGFSPLLGHIPLRDWARVHGVHTDHHLRQFGV